MSKPPLQDIEAVMKEFDENFGIDGPEKNSDSIGRGAGCDDCPGNIEMRREHKSFLHQVLLNQREAMIKLIEGKEVDCGRKLNQTHCKHCETNKVLDEIIQALTQK